MGNASARPAARRAAAVSSEQRRREEFFRLVSEHLPRLYEVVGHELGYLLHGAAARRLVETGAGLGALLRHQVAAACVAGR